MNLHAFHTPDSSSLAVADPMPETIPCYIHAFPEIKKLLPEVPGRFVAVLAHEIRNPLTTIKLATEMLRSVLQDEQHKSYLDIILRGSGKINDIVNDLLSSLPPLETGLEKHSLPALIDEILVATADRLQMKKITVVKKYEAPEEKIGFNRPKMKIALTNIIINAIEAMQEGTGKIRLKTKRVEDKYIIQVGDNGCGISKSDLKNIFQPYFTNKPGGLGIGLSATYDILRQNKVDIKVESIKGRGTRFILFFKR